MTKSTYDYILYKADGVKVEIGRGVPRKKWKEIKEILNADLLEMISEDYIDETIDEEMKKNYSYYMDEEARLKSNTNVRNPFFKVIRIDEQGQEERKKLAEAFGFEYITAEIPIVNGVEEWDIVGDVIMEKKHK